MQYKLLFMFFFRPHKAFNNMIRVVKRHPLRRLGDQLSRYMYVAMSVNFDTYV